MRLRGVLADTRPLAEPHFRRLWIGTIVTVIGAQLTVVAVPSQIYAITGSSAYVGLTGIFGLVPLIVFGLWGGALADAMDRRTLLIGTTVGLVATTTAFWAQAMIGNRNVWVLLGLFAVQQSFFAANQPARSAILPKLLEPALLPAANSLNMTVFQAGAIAGPLIAGALIPVVGLQWLYLVDSVTLFATLYAVVRLPSLPVDVAARVPGLRSVVDGVAYLRHHPVLLMSFLVDIVAMVFGMPRALFPELADVAFGGPTAGGVAFALLFAGIPAGAVLGGIFSGWVSRIDRQGLAVIWLILLWGAAMTGFGLAAGAADGAGGPFLVIAVVMLMVGGAADMASAAFRTSMLQVSAADEVRGRLQGIFLVVVAGGPRVADVAHGTAASFVGAATAAAGGGLLVVILTVAAAVCAPVFVRYRLSGADPKSRT
ncbi:MAG: MFS transporter [Dermatophilaceae bacterium]